ncbi:MAG: ATP-dependent helicase [Mycobacterium leprae]
MAGLTPAQAAAVTHEKGPLLVAAGPGSGKTTVIVRRVANLVQAHKVAPASILVVTFTRAAADTMKERATELMGAATARAVTFGTFHALAYRILRRAWPERELKILEEEEQFRLIRQLMRQAGLNTDDDAVEKVAADISRLRADVAPDEQWRPTGMKEQEFRRLFAGYQEAKAHRNLLDFDDLLHEAYALLKQQPALLEAYRIRYHYLMVDEFQDTNQVQWELIRLLAEPRRNLCVVGDEDQSIYGWRGASPLFLLEFARTFPDAVVITLDLNHRCPSPVVTAANRLVTRNRSRTAKVIKPVKSGGPAVVCIRPDDTLQEAESIAQMVRATGVPGEWAVIYRTNQQAQVLAQVMEREGVPYRVLGGLPNLYKRWQVQDVLAYLRAATGHPTAIGQVLNRPNRYIARAVAQQAESMATRQRTDILTALYQIPQLQYWQLRPVEELSDHLRRLSRMTAPEAIGYVRRIIGYDDYIQEYCDRAGGQPDEMFALLSEVEKSSPPLMLTAFLAYVDTFSGKTAQAGAGDAVTLVTCHKAKGLEFPRVVVAGAVEKVMPHRGSGDLEEERRLLYVAMTRAVDQLWLSAPQSYGGREVGPSPFIAEALS